MGGSHTDTIQSPKEAKEEKVDLRTTIQSQTKPQSQSLLKPLPVARQELEVHKNESKGEVHFHDRVREKETGQKFRAAVPVSVWWQAWNELKALERHRWTYIDTKNNTLLTVTIGEDAQGRMEAMMELEEFRSYENGDTFKSLDNFTTKAKK